MFEGKKVRFAWTMVQGKGRLQQVGVSGVSPFLPLYLISLFRRALEGTEETQRIQELRTDNTKHTFGVVEMVVLENGVIVPYRKQVIWTNIGENSDVAFTKARDFAPRPRKIDENDENGGCHPGKVTVCQKHRFDNPDTCSKATSL